MLSFSIENNVLEVKESLLSFKTKVNYWYYDIQNWKKSVTGNKNEVPSLKMDNASIEWVKKYYLTKVERSS